MRRALAAAIATMAAACQGNSADLPKPVEMVAANGRRAELRQTVLPTDLNGISGLSPAGDGAFWAVPERARRLFKISITPKRASVTAVLDIQGAPEGEDLESIALLGTTATAALAFGTETTEPRMSDHIVLGRVAGKAVVIEKEPWVVDYGPWGLTPGRNKGLEALCFADGTLVAISESVIRKDGLRLAPLAFRARDGHWNYGAVVLTSSEGKISALACRAGRNGHIEAASIERHFGVMRLLSWTLDTTQTSTTPLAHPVESSMIVDLAKAYPKAAPPRFEGLTYLDDGTLVLISDNDYGAVSEPTAVLQVRLR